MDESKPEKIVTLRATQTNKKTKEQVSSDSYESDSSDDEVLPAKASIPKTDTKPLTPAAKAAAAQRKSDSSSSDSDSSEDVSDTKRIIGPF